MLKSLKAAALAVGLVDGDAWTLGAYRSAGAGTPTGAPVNDAIYQGSSLIWPGP
jgi:hypothetical protein